MLYIMFRDNFQFRIHNNRGIFYLFERHHNRMVWMKEWKRLLLKRFLRVFWIKAINIVRYLINKATKTSLNGNFMKEAKKRTHLS